ncbi:hypothetical protein CAT7_04804 [Carnobacterium sp. AT7]|uniref:hypothetical protein n=1 Tax=Carnobacterium sp. AT7 TaxID=333990 RepID=UPI00015F19D2|nr:hypothetical protein [Carnobacterium sp. AT7]EDP68557.1 hypothetical protein CAT7_04804 [Carnobacterium sp. AT7]
MDTWLNIATAVGTIGAVIVSLILSGKETRNRERQEKEKSKKIASIINLSLMNILNRLEIYSTYIDKKINDFPYPYDGEEEYEDFKISGDWKEVSRTAYRQIGDLIEKRKNMDYEYLIAQLEVLRKLNINILPTDLIEIYQESFTATFLLEKWFLDIVELQGPNPKKMIETVEDHIKILNKLLNDLNYQH